MQLTIKELTMRSLLFATGIALLAVPAAQAGGYAAPVVEAEPLPVSVTPPPAAWQGGYAGAALGYAFGGDDEIGLNMTGRATSLGKAEISGANLSVRAGYRWQRDRWVVGPELSYTAGDIKDELDYATGRRFESQVNHTIALKLKTGYLMRPDMLVYGIAGWQKGDFTYDLDGVERDYDADGYVVGLGVEKKLTERLSLTGEYEYSDFGRTDVEIFSDVVSKATPSFSNVKMGLNFRF
ncbi:hypothetical protein B0A89_04910 [Paracoccus contaminans]|uniref:Outer membrane protein beta-barrel domain-containing protein n=2 Tax=Paracoccus contaminans TaxID=1945662 RepID=A0A1W6D0U6_9RHOB|nr:hypothetical protein B0A89_04910 [Paracoccus contaminans]